MRHLTLAVVTAAFAASPVLPAAAVTGALPRLEQAKSLQPVIFDWFYRKGDEDPYAYEYEPQRYYPNYDSGDWRPKWDYVRPRYDFCPPPYQPAWGYPPYRGYYDCADRPR